MPGQSTKDDPAYNAGGMDGEENPPCIGGYKRKKTPPLSEMGVAVFVATIQSDVNNFPPKNAFFNENRLF